MAGIGHQKQRSVLHRVSPDSLFNQIAKAR
jgi:hypothetical protein